MHCRHLYHARVSRQLTLEQIGVRTALSPTVLRHIDDGRYELLPSGVYARSYIRTFASAVGVDPDEALAEVEHLLPGAPDPIALLHEARGLTFRDHAARRFARWRERVEGCPVFSEMERWLRWPQVDSREVATAHRRMAAATIDATLLTLVDAFLVMLVSWSSGIPVGILLQQAGLVLAAFCALPIALYFLFFGGIAGSTLGQQACRLMRGKSDHPLTLPDILRRAVTR